MNIFRSLRLLPLAALLALGACDKDVAGTTDEHETTVAARVFLPDGSPAAGARVRIYAVDDTAKKAFEQVYASSDGSVTLPTLPAGEYNLVVTDDAGMGVVIDSLLPTGAGVPSMRSDTLRAMGRLKGCLQVEPQHMPKIAWVQILGLGIAQNLDTAGCFLLEVPAGRVTVAALTREPRYTPMFRSVKTIPDSTVDMGAIRLEYTGIPVVQGLSAIYDQTTGVVRVSWNRTEAFGVWGYRLERGNGEQTIYQEGAKDTVFLDTVYRIEEGPSAGTRSREYSVVALDTSMLDGPAWNFAKVQAASPWALEPGRFSTDTLGRVPDGCYDVDTLGGGLVCIKAGVAKTYHDSIGETYNHLGNTQGYAAWVSLDGLTWKKHPARFDSLSGMVAWKGLLWLVRAMESGDSLALPGDPWAVRLPLVGSAVVEAWSPQGERLRIDTIAVEPRSLGNRLLVRGDSLMLSSDSARMMSAGSVGPTGLVPVATSARAISTVQSVWEKSFQASLPNWWSTSIRRNMERLDASFSKQRLDESRPVTRWQDMDLFWVGYDLFGRTSSSVFPKWISDRTAWGVTQYRGDGENVPALITWKDCGLLLHQSGRLLRLCPED